MTDKISNVWKKKGKLYTEFDCYVVFQPLMQILNNLFILLKIDEY